MRRRGFTLIELMVAGMMTTIVLGGITTALSQLGSSKSISRQRLEAFSRCDMALRTLRKDIITVLRRDDLFDTRLLITNDTDRFQGQSVDRDTLLLFNGYLRANKEIDFNGEGMEYETQFRIEVNDVSSALWKRRDAILDDNPVGGGIATPIADGIISMQIEAFDGTSWFGQWDSDELGIPMALRVTISSTGMQYSNELYASIVTLRCVVPLDRFMPPADLLEIEEDVDGLDGLGGDGGIGVGAGGDGEDGQDGDQGGDSGSGSGGGDTPGTKPSDPSRPGSGTGSPSSGVTPVKINTITDPDGNVHEIPQ